jgi:hypothetical protein
MQLLRRFLQSQPESVVVSSTFRNQASSLLIFFVSGEKELFPAACIQSDRIGRIFAHWAIVFTILGNFFCKN